MNGKKAKALRSIAREVTPGQPEKMYGRRKAGGPIQVHPQTTRAVNQELKKKFLEGKKQ